VAVVAVRCINITRNLFAFAALSLNVTEIHDICCDCNWKRISDMMYQL